MKEQTHAKITPFLWFDGKAEEAANFYVALFEDSNVVNVSRGPDGKAFMVTFQLAGQEYYALNGGPRYSLTPAFSLFVHCKTQEEVDGFWDKLCADGGEESRCGWLVNKFGLSWQIIPDALGELMGDPDPAKAGRVMQAMLQMNKIELAATRQAYVEAA